MKRLATIFAAAVLLAALPGCSPVEEYVQGELEKSASSALEEAYSEDADYQQYLALQAQGQLDEEGNYISPTLNQLESGETTAMTGSVHVTFATNPCLSITYYTNAERTEPITDLSACYLNPGDSIYASNAVSTNPNSNLYRLAGFRIYEYDAAGSRLEQNTKEQAASASGLVYAIPAGFTGSEIAIFPLGEYPDRELALEVYTVDENGRAQALSNAGQWYIDGEKVQDGQATVSAVKSYTLSFRWDDKQYEGKYFYITASPTPFTMYPNKVKKVEFWEADPTDEDRTYRVEMRRCISLTFECDEKATVTVSDEEGNVKETREIKKNKSEDITGLIYGDDVRVVTDGKIKNLSSDDASHISQSPTKEGYIIEVTAVTNTGDSGVTQATQTYSITLEESGQYGSATYKLDGKKVEGNEIHAEAGQQLEITYKLKDEYTFNNNSTGISIAKLGSTIGNAVFGESEKYVITINATMADEPINPDDYFTVVKKGG